MRSMETVMPSTPRNGAETLLRGNGAPDPSPTEEVTGGEHHRNRDAAARDGRHRTAHATVGVPNAGSGSVREEADCVRFVPSETVLDPGIAPYVEVLRAAGVETFDSCQGGDGHALPEPMVRFHGERPEGFRALAVALQVDLPVLSLNRCWSIEDREPVGPHWEIVFRHKAGWRSPGPAEARRWGR